MDRRERIVASLPPGRGLEIGAGYNPLAAGDPSLDVRTLDHLDRDGLVEKYAASGVDVSRIRPVDYVWSGERYADLVGKTRFDWVLASHVIEHVPDLVGFVNDCAEILTPGGMLTLLVPDRRCEFDYYRPPAGLGAVIDAHLQDRRKSSPGLAAEFFLYMAQLDGRDTWTRADHGAPALCQPEWAARSLMERAQGGEYIDIHAWVFTPSSFRLLVEDLHVLGLSKLREAAFGAAMDHEVFIQLSRNGPGPGLSRQELCALVLAEQQAGDGEPRHLESESLAALRAENRALKAELDAHRATASWRLTAPLRAIRRLTR